MKRKMQAGQTSVLMKVWIQNASTGSGLSGLAYNTSGLTAYYIRDGQSADTQINLASATLGTWTSGGFIAVDGTNMPGLYEIGIPNAALAAGVDTVHMMLQGAGNMVPCVLEIELDAVNYQSSTGFVSSVPAVAGNVGGSVAGSVASVTGNIGGNVTGSVGSISGVTFPGNFGNLVIDGNGYVRLAGPFKINTASGFSFRMVSSTDNKTAYTAGGVSGTRTISGGSSNAVAGSITQIGSTNEYSFSGTAADFNGTEIHFAFTASGANPVYITVNTAP
jgi:hypothetical protein